MSAEPAPTPRSGRLLAGGPNSLELLWATATLTAFAVAATVCTLLWVAIAIDARLAGTETVVTLAELPGLLRTALTGDSAALTGQLARPWRAGLLAAGLLAATLIGVVHAAGRWWRWRAGWLHRRRQADRTGSRVWASRSDLAELTVRAPRAGAGERPAEGRLWIGSLGHSDVAVPARTSVIAIAPTRTGKSSRLVVPNLLRWDGPAVVTSVKRDVYDLTAARRQRFGEVHLFDPSGATGLASVRWSPLLSATTFPEATTTATWLADAAAVEDKHEAAKFWETLATKLLAPMLFAAANSGRTIHDVALWVDRSAFAEVAELLDGLRDDDATAAWQAIRDLPNETRGSVLGTAMAIFRGFGSPRVRAATSCTPGDVDNTLDIDQLLAANGTLYLVSPEYEQAELRPVFVALIQAVYRAAVALSTDVLEGAPLNPPLLLMLDEAGNIAPLRSLPKIAATGAGQGITLMTIWQDRAQIRALYGDAERTVIANHTTSVWLPGSQDLDTLKLLAELIGDQWVAASSTSSAADGGVSVSQSSERIDVAPPAFLRTLSHGTAVMLSGNTPPALVAAHAYYQQRRWRQLIDPDQLARHTAMHDGTGPTTRKRLADHAVRSRTIGTQGEVASTATATRPARRGTLANALHATYPTIAANPHAHRRLGPAATSIPPTLAAVGHPWPCVQLPELLASQTGIDTVDLSDERVRRTVLPVWLESGPAELLARHVSLSQLAADWPQLPLSDLLRDAWEACYPQLASRPADDGERAPF
jgi:type IV secretion system protein VirD4